MKIYFNVTFILFRLIPPRWKNKHWICACHWNPRIYVLEEVKPISNFCFVNSKKKSPTKYKQPRHAMSFVIIHQMQKKILIKFIHPQAPDVLNFSLNKKKYIILVQGFFFKRKKLKRHESLISQWAYTSVMNTCSLSLLILSCRIW